MWTHSVKISAKGWAGLTHESDEYFRGVASRLNAEDAM